MPTSLIIKLPWKQAFKNIAKQNDKDRVRKHSVTQFGNVVTHFTFKEPLIIHTSLFKAHEVFKIS